MTIFNRNDTKATEVALASKRVWIDKGNGVYEDQGGKLNLNAHNESSHIIALEDTEWGNTLLTLSVELYGVQNAAEIVDLAAELEFKI